jgi:hypothetical protein
MLKILIRIAIPLCVLWIAFFRFANNLYNILIVALLVLLGFLYYVTEDVVTEKMVEKATGEKGFFSVKGGYIADKKATQFSKGRLVITSSEIRFYKRAAGSGGCALLYSVSVPELASFSLGKVDEFHNGIVFTLKSGAEVLFSSKEIASKEAEVKKALAWE